MAGNFRWIGKSPDGKTVTLQHFQGGFAPAAYATPEWLQLNEAVVRTAAVLDIETTGLNPKTDKIIELGIRKFQFNRSTGEVLRIMDGFSQLNDPGAPLSKEVARLTGLTDAMLAGKKIDWHEVDQHLSGCSLVIAHNAAFDRPFVDSKSTVSAQLPWGCSCKQIPWNAKGFPSSKLEVLSIYHGFFVDAHRAIQDADATLHLLMFPDPETARPYLHELLTTARKPLARVHATGAPFESKDLLRGRNYQWNAAEKCWHRVLPKEFLSEEVAWLESAVYKGTFRGQVHDLAIADNFKSTG